MARKEMTVERYNEIKRLLGLSISVRQISKAMRCTRRTVRQVRDEETADPGKEKVIDGPLWALAVGWDTVMREVIAGHPLKLIWEEMAKEKVTYANFWKQFHRKFPEYGQETVVHRFFEPADRCEVDYAGDTVEWIDLQSGRVREADVFVGVLGFSQLIFACAASDAKSPRFLESHNKMFAAFGGVPKIVVPDCLKQGVTKTHLYDPDINEAYRDLARHYGTAVVPARAGHPKDKSIIEGVVNIVMRQFRWRCRGRTFTSLAEINTALRMVVDEVNHKPHTRFKVSRYDRWLQYEQPKLRPLPAAPFEVIEWKEAKLHPDSHIFLEGTYYSAPHIYRGNVLKVKLTSSHVEIFDQLDRIAVHPRVKGHKGRFISDTSHLPPNARAYHEATPQNLLVQAKNLSAELHQLLDELFRDNAIAHLRRAQGLVREAGKEINALGYTQAREHIQKAIATMTQYNKIRVPYFRELLNRFRLEETDLKAASIQRRPGNEMLRYTGQNFDLQ
jgi:hypothetical protein